MLLCSYWLLLLLPSLSLSGTENSIETFVEVCDSLEPKKGFKNGKELFKGMQESSEIPLDMKVSLNFFTF